MLASYFSLFHQYLEWALHKYFRKMRVVRPEIKDGQTEWFLVGGQELVQGVNRIRAAMKVLFGDKDYEGKTCP